MAFLKWSEATPSAKKILAPDFGLRSWETLNSTEKHNFLQHLYNSGWVTADSLTWAAAHHFADAYKARNFCPRLLGHGGPHISDGMRWSVELSLESCCKKVAEQDAVSILMDGDRDVVYEFLSHYAIAVEADPLDKEKLARFIACFNDVAEQFCLDVVLTSSGFVPRQEEKIIQSLYVPTLTSLADPKWEPVNRDLADAFEDFRKATPEAYSSSITHAVSAVQAFLQITVFGATGHGENAALLKQAISQNKIPDDGLSQLVLKNILSTLMQERQKKGDPHPKGQYGDEKSALLVLNLTMIFIQHCLRG